MAARRIRPKLTSAQTDAKYIAMGEKMMGAVTDDEEAGALEAANAGKFGRPYKYSAYGNRDPLRAGGLAAAVRA